MINPADFKEGEMAKAVQTLKDFDSDDAALTE